MDWDTLKLGPQPKPKPSALGKETDARKVGKKSPKKEESDMLW